ncbi:MAG: hypothetical protein OXL96_07835 [Candidatus Poribacteria bacterium]|nr:hypothetical protein [Candidatus Poribacteria bacterium]
MNKFEENYLSLLADFYNEVPVSMMAKTYDVSSRHIYRWQEELQPVLSAITPEIAEACLHSDARTLNYDPEQLEDGSYTLRWRTQIKRRDTDLRRVIRLAERFEKKTVSVALSASDLPDYLVLVDFKDGVHYVAAMIDEIPNAMKKVDKENSFISLDAIFEVPAETPKADDGILREFFRRLLIDARKTISDGLSYFVPTVVTEREIQLTEEDYQDFSVKSDALQFQALQDFAKSEACRALPERKTLQEKYISEIDIQRLEAYLDKVLSEDEDEDETSEPEDRVVNVSSHICIVAFTDRETWFYAEEGGAEKSLRQQKSRSQEWRKSENLQRVRLSDVGFYYIPRGNIKKSWECFDREQLLRGGRNTGKTLSNAWRGHIAACQYPGTRIIVFREKLSTVHDSFGKTFERKIAGLDSESNLTENLFIRRVGKRDDDGFVYWNGATITYAGVQDRGDVLSMEYDLAINPQSEQIQLMDWVYVLTSIGRGVGNNTPYHFLLGDCNPPEIEGDFHWLFKRPEITVHDTDHTDNPELYDSEGQVTRLGQSYVGTLESLPTDAKTRFLEGRSANSEMKVFSQFSKRHIISLDEFHSRLEMLRVERCFLGFDAGYSPNPGVLLLGIETDGGFFVLRGTCRIGWLDEQWVGRAQDYYQFVLESFDQRIYALYSEHDPQIIDRFIAKGFYVTKAEKRDKLQSIRQLQGLIAQQDQFFIVREHVDDPDELMAVKNVPQDLIAELIAYRWTDAHLRTGGDPVPQDGNDHWIDALLYIIRTAKIGGEMPQVIFQSQHITREQVLAQKEGRWESGDSEILPRTPRHRYQDSVDKHNDVLSVSGYRDPWDVVLERGERGPGRYLHYIQQEESQLGSGDEEDDE